MTDLKPLHDLLQHVRLNAMDRQIVEDGHVIGWEKSPRLLALIEAADAVLVALPLPETEGETRDAG